MNDRDVLSSLKRKYGENTADFIHFDEKFTDVKGATSFIQKQFCSFSKVETEDLYSSSRCYEVKNPKFSDEPEPKIRAGEFMAFEDRSFEEIGCKFKICLSGEFKETLTGECENSEKPLVRDQIKPIHPINDGQ